MKRSMRVFSVSQLIMCVAMVMFSFSASAKNRGSIKVQVMDKENQPVDYAMAELRDVATGKVVKKCLTNERGELILKRVKPGQYIVAVNTPGFNPFESAKLTVVAGKEIQPISQLYVMEGNLTNDLNITETPKVVRDSTLQTN